MLNRSTRRKGQRFDYKVFSSTGERFTHTQAETMPVDESNTSIINELVLVDEIGDFMDDNSPDLIQNSTELILNSIGKIESLWMRFRTEHRIIRNTVW